MSTNAEIIIEGEYLYFQKEVNYSQENFKLVSFPDTKTFHIYAEILSRIENGEFLKVVVDFEMNQNYLPTFVRIEKSLGNRYSQEILNFDLSTQELKYVFQNSRGTQDFTRPLTAKHYLTSPAFSTSAIFTLSKKLDATGRSPISFIGSQNDWSYEHPPEEKIVYAEFKSREIPDFKLNNTPLSASHLCLYEFDTSAMTTEIPVEIFLSKHYGLPYQLIHGDQKIVIKNLKRT